MVGGKDMLNQRNEYLKFSFPIVVRIFSKSCSASIEIFRIFEDLLSATDRLQYSQVPENYQFIISKNFWHVICFELKKKRFL
jgi:hypothetical protein